MREVLVFADAALDSRQRAWLLDRLGELRQRPVICQVHLRPLRSSSGTPLPESRAGPGAAPRAPSSCRARRRVPGRRGRARTIRASSEDRDVELAQARRRLCELVELVRSDGHVAHGELLAGPLIRALTRGIAERTPDRVLLLTSDHRLELLLRRDLERRLRHAGPRRPIQVARRLLRPAPRLTAPGAVGPGQ